AALLTAVLAPPPPAAGAAPPPAQRPAADLPFPHRPSPDSPLPDQPFAGPPAVRPPVGELLGSFRTLYREARSATETYRGINDRLERQQSQVRRLGGELALARTRLAEAREAAGRLAREEYRSTTGGLSPFMRAMLSDDPQLTLDQRHLYRRMAAVRAAAELRLTGGEAKLAELTGKARKALSKQQSLAARRKRQRDVVRARLTAVQEMLASLPPEQSAGFGPSPGTGSGPGLLPDPVSVPGTDSATGSVPGTGTGAGTAPGTGTGPVPGLGDGDAGVGSLTFVPGRIAS
ncbi:MAG TPA: hypothetical protein DEQ61_16580, partial [Streptomyces sp.]|nr:hypothetical protein [Streptomyces sp.]